MLAKKTRRFSLAATLLLSANYVHADTAYITDTVTVAIFSSTELKGEPLERLISGTLVDVLQSSGKVAEVKTSSGKTGWLRTSFLTTNLPAVIKLENAQHELSKANTELNAANEQLAELEKELAAVKKGAVAAKDLGWMKAELAKARKKAAALEKQLKSQAAEASEAGQQTATFEQQIATLEADKHDLEQRLAATLLINGEAAVFDEITDESVTPTTSSITWGIVALILGLVAGFGACYYWLDRRLRQRFGGVRVY